MGQLQAVHVCVYMYTSMCTNSSCTAPESTCLPMGSAESANKKKALPLYCISKHALSCLHAVSTHLYPPYGRVRMPSTTPGLPRHLRNSASDSQPNPAVKQQHLL